MFVTLYNTLMIIGHCYAICGVHPDNVDRTNKKNHDEWLQKIDELAHKSNCIGILSGLNLSRELVTHFPQELLLTKSIDIADKLSLPLVLYISPDSNDQSSLTRAIEILSASTSNSLEHQDEEEDDNDEESKQSPMNIVLSKRMVIIHDAMTALSAKPEQFQKVYIYN